MNDFDRDNLEFFINASESEFDEWADQAQDNELQYAINLIRIARRELIDQELEILDAVDEIEEAAKLLKKFTLAGQ